MKVYIVAYIPHTKEDKPEVHFEHFGWLMTDENKHYREHYNESEEMGVEYINKLFKLHDSYLDDDDIYYYLVQGIDASEDAFGRLSKDSMHTPQRGDYYRRLVYDDDLAIIIEDVF